MPSRRSRAGVAPLVCCFLFLAAGGDLDAQTLQERIPLDIAHLGGFLVDTEWVHFASDASYLLFREADALIAAPLSLTGEVGRRFEVLRARRSAAILAYDVVQTDDELVVYLLSKPSRRVLSLDSHRLDRQLRPIGRSRRLGRMRVRATGAEVRVGSQGDVTAIVIGTRNAPRAAAPDPVLGSIFFLVTDARGQRRRPIHDLTPRREPNISSDVGIDRPRWSGSRWLIPVSHKLIYAYRSPTRPKALVTFHFDAEAELIGVADADASNPDVERRRVFAPEVFNSQDTYRLLFLSESAGAQPADTLRLLLQHQKVTDFAASYDAYEADYRIISVDSDGNPVGRVRMPRIPPFRHRIPYRENTAVMSFGETVTPARAPGGATLLLMTRSLNVARSDTNEFLDGIHRLRVFAYDDRRGRLTRRSATTTDRGPGVETSKRVNVVDGELRALASRFVTEETEETIVFKTVFFLERFGR